MRDPKRVPRILKQLRTLWEANPDQRLGQLMINITPRDPVNARPSPMFMVEDEEWEAAIQRCIEGGRGYYG